MTPDPDAQHKKSSVNNKRFFNISDLLMQVVTITKQKSDIAKCINLLVKQGSLLLIPSNTINNNNNNNNLLQLGCHPVAAVILHVNKT